MANIFDYKSKAAYESATDRPTFQSSMSYDGDETHVDGVNVLLPFRECNCEEGDMIVFDTLELKRKVLKWRSYNAGTFDTSRYIISTGHYSFPMGRKAILTANKTPGSFMWAAKCYFRLTGFDLTATGSLTFKTYYSWKAYTGNVVSWDAGATLTDIAAKFNGLGLSASYFKAAMLADGTGIGVWVNYPTTSNVDSILSITEQTGAVEREYMQLINGVEYVPQYCNTNKIIPGRLGGLSVTRRNGLYTSWAGCYYERFYNCYSVEGSAKFEGETSSSVMTKAMFESLAEATDETQKAFYDKYNGDYPTYLRSRMVAIDSGRGVMAESYDNFVEQTRLLAEVMTVDYDRNPIPAFPAAYQAHHYGVTSGFDTGFEVGQWGLPSTYAMVRLINLVGLNSSKKTEFNKAIDKFNSAGNFYGQGYYFWTSAEYSASISFVYYGYNGLLDNDNRGNTLSVRPLLALEFDS
jgi:hypothetical protein